MDKVPSLKFRVRKDRLPGYSRSPRPAAAPGAARFGPGRVGGIKAVRACPARRRVGTADPGDQGAADRYEGGERVAYIRREVAAKFPG